MSDINFSIEEELPIPLLKECELNFPYAEAVVQRCSVKKGVLKNSLKFTEKHRCQSPFLINL